MELTLIILVGVVFAILGLVCVALVAIGLPGAWMIIAMAVLIELGDALYLTESHQPTFDWRLLGACVLAAALGELLEFLAGALGARTGGSSRAGMFGALIGGIVGAIAGIALPVPIVGSLIGAVIGTFVGAIMGELNARDTGVRDTLRPATAATIGRLLGTLSKVPIAAAIWVALTIAVFWR